MDALGAGRNDFFITGNGTRWIWIIKILSNRLGVATVLIYGNSDPVTGKSKQTPNGLLVYS